MPLDPANEERVERVERSARTGGARSGDTPPGTDLADEQILEDAIAAPPPPAADTNGGDEKNIESGKPGH
jgi:hypothetical protein